MAEFTTDIFERLGIKPRELFMIDFPTEKLTVEVKVENIIMIDVDFSVYSWIGDDVNNKFGLFGKIKNGESIINELLEGKLKIMEVPEEVYRKRPRISLKCDDN